MESACIVTVAAVATRVQLCATQLMFEKCVDLGFRRLLKSKKASLFKNEAPKSMDDAFAEFLHGNA